MLFARLGTEVIIVAPLDRLGHSEASVLSTAFVQECSKDVVHCRYTDCGEEPRSSGLHFLLHVSRGSCRVNEDSHKVSAGQEW